MPGHRVGLSSCRPRSKVRSFGLIALRCLLLMLVSTPRWHVNCNRSVFPVSSSRPMWMFGPLTFNVLVSIDEFAPHQTQLIEICWQVNHLGQLSLPSLISRCIEHQRVWLGLGGMCSLVSGGRQHCVIPHGKWDLRWSFRSSLFLT